MNELRELAERLEWDWKDKAKHFEIVRAERCEGQWHLVVQEMKEEKEDEESSKAE